MSGPGTNPGPLAEPGPELTLEQIDRYRRQLTLPDIGPEGQRRLLSARVLVVGAGGLGSPVLHYLAGAGVGRLGIVDDDVVSVSNLHRQVIHTTEAIGTAKTASAAAQVARLNPEVTVAAHQVRLTSANVVELVSGYDLVIDGADNFATRYLVADAAEITGTPVVWGSILRHTGQISVFFTGSASPKGERGPGYRDLFPEPPPPGEVPSCAEGGVLGVLPGVIGTIMATEAIKLITGIGETLWGRVLIYDALAMQFDELRLSADPDRSPVSEIADPSAAGGSCEVPGAPGVSAAADPDEIAPERLVELLAGAKAGRGEVVVIDVREDWEHALSAIEGSILVPLGLIEDRGAAALPAAASGTVVVHCQAGVRSARALELLRAEFASREQPLVHLAGGVDAWRAAGQPLQPGG